MIGKNELTKQLSSDQITEFKEAFCVFDSDRTGFINIQRLGAVMRSLGQDAEDADLRDMIQDLGGKGDNSIDFPVFCKLMSRNTNLSNTADALADAFRVFDKDGDGFVSTAEASQLPVCIAYHHTHRSRYTVRDVFSCSTPQPASDLSSPTAISTR